MTDAILDGESVLDFVTRHYEDLKNQAQDDNNIPGPSNENITDVIAQIDNLYKTITTISHEKIVEQLKALRTPYNTLDLDTTSYTRYIQANNSLNMIVGGFNEVEEEVEEEGKGEAGSPASAPASKASGSTALVPASRALVSKASTASGTASNALVPASESALVLTSRASAPASIAPASIASTASGSTALVVNK
jgi:hypothetical protein